MALISDLNNAKFEAETFKREKSELEQQCSTLRAEVKKALNSKDLELRKEAERKADDLQIQLDSMKSGASHLVQLKESLAKDKQSLELKCTALQSELESAQGSHHEGGQSQQPIDWSPAQGSNAAAHEESQTASAAALEDVRRETEALEEQQMEAHSSMEDLRYVMRGKLEEASEEHQQLKSETEQVELQCQTLREKLGGLQNTEENLSQPNATVDSGLSEQIQTLNAELETANQINQQLKQQLDSVEQQLQAELQTSSELQGEVESAKAGTGELEQSKETLAKEKSELEVKCTELQAEVESAKAGTGELEQTLAKEKSELEAKCTELQAEVESAKAGTMELKQSKETLDEEKSELEAKCAELQAEVENAKAGTDALKAELLEQQDALALAAAAPAESLDPNDVVQLESMQHLQADRLIELEETQSKMVDRIEEQEREKASAQKEVRELNAEIVRLQALVEQAVSAPSSPVIAVPAVNAHPLHSASLFV